MRLWAKILVGALAALVFLCLVSSLLLVQSGAWDRAKDFGGGVMGISKNAKGIEALDEKIPFQEPADGAIAENRLLAFIEVRKAVKPSADLYDAWIKDHEGEEDGDFTEAREAIQLTGDAMRAFRSALESQKMSPREYAWLDRKTKDALSQLGSSSASERERDLLDTLRALSHNPRLTPGEREGLQAKVKEAEGRLGGPSEPASPDAALCAKHRKELEETALGEVAGQMVRGFANTPHGRRRPRGDRPPSPGSTAESP